LREEDDDIASAATRELAPAGRAGESVPAEFENLDAKLRQARGDCARRRASSPPDTTSCYPSVGSADQRSK
jgi:hypothetical protein